MLLINIYVMTNIEIMLKFKVVSKLFLIILFVNVVCVDLLSFLVYVSCISFPIYYTDACVFFFQYVFFIKRAETAMELVTDSAFVPTCFFFYFVHTGFMEWWLLSKSLLVIDSAFVPTCFFFILFILALWSDGFWVNLCWNIYWALCWGGFLLYYVKI
jgi:hypothetical protein